MTAVDSIDSVNAILKINFTTLPLTKNLGRSTLVLNLTLQIMWDIFAKKFIKSSASLHILKIIVTTPISMVESE